VPGIAPGEVISDFSGPRPLATEYGVCTDVVYMDLLHVVPAIDLVRPSSWRPGTEWARTAEPREAFRCARHVRRILLEAVMPQNQDPHTPTHEKKLAYHMAGLDLLLPAPRACLIVGRPIG